MDKPLGRCHFCRRVLWNDSSVEDEVRFHSVCLKISAEVAARLVRVTA